jgi:hypothetical protein
MLVRQERIERLLSCTDGIFDKAGLWLPVIESNTVGAIPGPRRPVC